MFAFETIGGIRVYRPRQESELRFKAEILDHLRKREWPSELRTATDVNDAIKYFFNFCSEVFDKNIVLLGSRHASEFLLAQYDNWERIRKAHNDRQLNSEDSEKWNRWGAQARRAILFALEGIVALNPSEEPPGKDQDLLWLTDLVMISAEIMVQTASQSSMTYGVFPDECVLIVNPDDPEEYFKFQLVPVLQTRKDVFFARRANPVPEKYKQFQLSESTSVLAALDPIFESERGLKLTQIIGAALAADKFSRRAAGDGFDVRFILREVVLDATSKNLGVKRETLEPLFNAFILTPEAAEYRELWKPKQEERIIRRPFLQMPHKLGPHLAWVSPLATGAVGVRLQDLSFRKCPTEWETSAIIKEITTFSQRLDLDWNKLVHQQLLQRGMRGEMGVKKVDTVSLLADGGPGEIDGLYADKNDNSLVVVEVKRTQPGFDPDYWRGELDDYLRREKCYVAKHKKKIEWVKANWALVCQHLVNRGLLNSMPTASPQIRAVMITKYPSIAFVASQDLPILPLSWVLEDFDTQGRWPF